MQSKSNKYIHIGKIIKLQKKASIEKRTAYQTAQQTFGQAQLYQKATGRTARECFEAKGTNGSAGKNPS